MPGLPVAGQRDGAPPDARALHGAGVAALRQGRVEEALALLARAAVAAPDNAAVQGALGEAHRAAGRPDVALSHYRRAASLRPGAASLTNLAGALLELGRPSESARTYQAAFRHDARSPELLHGWGLALRSLGRLSEAADAFSRAVSLTPGFEAAQAELVETCMQAGAWDLGLKAASDGLAACDSVRLRLGFVDCARQSPPFEHPGLRERLRQALAEGWTRPRDLARFVCAMLGAGPATDPSDPLLALMLTLAPVADPGLERRLTERRDALGARQAGGGDLHDGTAEGGSGSETAWREEACLLARQCFINEYVWALSEAESRRAAALGRAVQAALDSGAPPAADALAALALYAPLGSLREAGSLLSWSWPTPVAALLDQQVREPAEEARLAERIAHAGAIADPVSRRVQAQYEENPYPRWTALGAPPEPVRLAAWLAGRFPGAPGPASGVAPGSAPDRGAGRDDGAEAEAESAPVPLEVLVAGCGTGQQAVETARAFAPARLLAIDLSRRSLAYAARMSGSLGLAAIEYLQADLLQAPALGRSFDLVCVGGVLHHLADPYAGWRALLAVLRPGGVMNVLVYTVRGRSDVAQARAWIARAGFDASPEGIRQCRAAMLASDEGWARRLVASPDFWSASLCRDLLFHVHETPLELPGIARFVERAGLELIGVEVSEDTERAFLAAAAPQGLDEGVALRDLARWDAFEAANPGCFASMLNLWLYRPGPG